MSIPKVKTKQVRNHACADFAIEYHFQDFPS